MSTYEKERIDSNQKMSSGGTKKNLGHFKLLADEMSQNQKNAKSFKSFVSQPKFEIPIRQEPKRYNDLSDNIRTERQKTHRQFDDSTQLYNKIQQAPKK